MFIDGKWYTTPELAAYIKELKARISTLEAALEKRLETAEAENTELKARVAELEDKHWNECRQIAHYDNDIKSLKAQIADLKRCIKSLNSDYLTGYISALSAVEGMIDKMLGV